MSVTERRIGTTARALVLVPVLPRGRRPAVVPAEQGNGEVKAVPPLHSPQDRLAEAVGLAHAIDLDVLAGIIVPLQVPRPSTLFGKGKVEELATRVEAEEIELVVIDHAVTPIQQRNLEKALNTKDQVFATLDPTMREVKLPSARRVILSDTVGFISDLPTMLVAAFRATLEEVVEADLVLHVRDIAHAETDAQCADVEAVLADLGIDAHAADAPLIEVWNKVDLLDEDRRQEALGAARRAAHRPALVSAVTGEGVDALLDTIDRHFSVNDEIVDLVVPAADGAVLAWLHANADVLAKSTDDDGTTHARIRIERARHGRLIGRLKGTGVTLAAFPSG